MPFVQPALPPKHMVKKQVVKPKVVITVKSEVRSKIKNLRRIPAGPIIEVKGC